MNFDFHVHGLLSSSINFDLEFFQQLIRQAKFAGLDGLALTDHFNAAHFEELHQTLADQFELVDEVYEIHGVKVFTGIEVEVQEGMHLLAIAEREQLAEYYQRLRGHMEPKNYCTTAEFFALQADLNTITIAAHPFREQREITQIDETHYPQFDAMGLNARDMYFLGEQILIPRTQEFSLKYQLPIVAGSDSHHFLQIGAIYNEFSEPATTIDGLRKLVKENRHKITINQALREKIDQASEEKQAIKDALARMSR